MSTGVSRTGELAGVTIVAGAALGLGILGFAIHRGASESALDLLYLSIQLFVLQSGAVPPPIPWSLEIARFLAPGVAAYATFRLLANILRDQVDALAATIVRRHTIICGSTDVAVLLAVRLCDNGARVVLVATDPAPGAVTQLRHAGARVLAADPAIVRTLRRAGLRRASQVAIATGSDVDGARVAMAVRQAHESAGRAQELVCFLAVDSARLCQMLRAHRVMTTDQDALRVEFINLSECSALALLQEHPISARGSSVVFGHTALANELIAQLQVNASPSSPVVQLGPTSQPPATAAIIYICLDDDDEALDRGLALHWKVPADVPIVVVQARTSGLGDLLSVASEREAYRNVHLFSVLDRTCRPEILLREVTESLAQGLHGRYLEQQRQAGSLDGNPAGVPWERLPETYRRANRQQALGIGAALDRLGLSVVSGIAGPAAFRFGDDEVDAMAMAEHERWVNERTIEGWRYAAGPKDSQSRTNPNLRDWTDLDDQAREVTRQAIRALPDLLAGHSLSVVRRPRPAR